MEKRLLCIRLWIGRGHVCCSHSDGRPCVLRPEGRQESDVAFYLCIIVRGRGELHEQLSVVVNHEQLSVVVNGSIFPHSYYVACWF